MDWSFFFVLSSGVGCVGRAKVRWKQRVDFLAVSEASGLCMYSGWVRNELRGERHVTVMDI